MSQNVSVKTGTELEDAVKKALDEERSLTYEALQNAVDKTAKETVENTKAKSPVRTGIYQKNWKSKKAKGGVGIYGRTVYNDKKYRLTHLLENGHEIKGFLEGKGRTHTRAIKHIQSDDVTDRILEKNLEEEMNKG